VFCAFEQGVIGAAELWRAFDKTLLKVAACLRSSLNTFEEGTSAAWQRRIDRRGRTSSHGQSSFPSLEAGLFQLDLLIARRAF